MSTFSARFTLLCPTCIFSHGVSPLTVVSQEAKPDEVASKITLRAGVNGIGVPACIHCPAPEYPEKARADKLQGSVLLAAVVTPEGKATKVILVKGLGS